MLHFGGGGAFAGIRGGAVRGGRTAAQTVARTVQSVLGDGNGRAEHRVRVAMWHCEACDSNTFLQRRSCFRCRGARLDDAAVVEEYWRVEMLPVDVRRRLEGQQQGMGLEGGRVEVGGGEGDRGGKGFGEDGAGGKGGKPMRGEGPRDGATDGKGTLGKGKASAKPVGRINVEVVEGLGEGKGGGAMAGIGTGTETWNAAGANGGAPSMEVDEMLGRSASNATRAKAKAKAEPQKKPAENKHVANTAGSVRDVGRENGAWPQEPHPYDHPWEHRVVLAGRAEALRTREAELRQKAQGSDDVRVQLARKKMGETELQLKAAGGKTQSKLVFTVMDARRDVGEAEKALCAAKEALAEASKQAAERLQAKGRTEARVRAREGELANCKSRVAHLWFQFAAEAGSEVQGFEELSTAMQEVWASVEEAGMQETLRKLQRVAAFIQKFRLVDYAASADSELRELASGDTDSVATRVVGDEAGTGEAAMEVQQQVAAVGNEMVPVQHIAPCRLSVGRAGEDGGTVGGFGWAFADSGCMEGGAW